MYTTWADRLRVTGVMGGGAEGMLRGDRPLQCPDGGSASLSLFLASLPCYLPVLDEPVCDLGVLAQLPEGMLLIATCL